jgi:hypothetical protein
MKKTKLLAGLNAFVLIAMACLLVSCKDVDQLKLAAAGGVDGSGGNLRIHNFDSFKNWVEVNHPSYVRDVIHRLVIIDQNYPDSFSNENEILKRFLGERPEKFEVMLKSVKYNIVSGTCQSNNHPESDSDSAVNNDKVICISYQAFKRFTSLEIIRKLISMTIHELSHIRGFDEADASKIQALFENDFANTFAGETILVNNGTYERNRDMIGKVGKHLSNAMSALSSNSQRSACNSVLLAGSQAESYFIMMAQLPNTMAMDILDSFMAPAYSLTETCDNKTIEELKIIIPKLLKESIRINRMLEAYESPICTGSLCTRRRWVNQIANTPEEMLLKWNLVKQDVGMTRPQTESKNIHCKLTNLTDHKEVKLVREDDLSYEIEKDELEAKNFKRISIQKDDGIKSIANVSFQHYGFIQLMSANGFTDNWETLNGFLQQDVNKEVSARFAIMNPNIVEYDTSGKYGDYTLPSLKAYNNFNPMFHAITSIPTIERNYELKCELN